MKRDRTIKPPNVSVEINSVSELNNETQLFHVNIKAGLFVHSAYVQSEGDSDFAEGMRRQIEENGLPHENIFFGDVTPICEQILIRSGIWSENKKISPESNKFLNSKLGKKSVDQHENEFGEDFRLLAAKKVIELRGWSFSPVWYALGVLVMKDYYKQPFEAGALWALLEQKLFREEIYLETLKTYYSVNKGRAKGSQKTKHKAEYKREVLLQLSAQLLTEQAFSFGMLSDKAKAEKLRELALKLDPNLFYWAGKPQTLQYFLRFIEDNRSELRQLSSKQKD